MGNTGVKRNLQNVDLFPVKIILINYSYNVTIILNIPYNYE